MVWGVCRRVLHDPHAAADAFQATFLVLVRRAGAVRIDDSLGRWLYGVSRRVAARARKGTARRTTLDPGAIEPAVLTDGEPELERAEVLAVLDEEIGRLPGHYRAAIVLCDLGGLSHEEAARQLGCAVGTIGSRVARGRERLRLRLTRRGLAPTGAAVALAIPPRLAEATTQLAVRASATGAVAPAVAALVEGALLTMVFTRWIVAGTALLMFGAGAAVLAFQASDAPKAAQDVLIGESGRPNPEVPARPAPPPEQLGMRNEALDRLLDQPLAIDHPNKSTLEKFLKYLKEATTKPGSGNSGIPIYVDPVGIDEVGVRITSPIDVVAMEGAPLRQNIRRALLPLGLGFRTKNGLLMISSRDATLEQQIQELQAEVKALTERLRSAEQARGKRP
jgi:RNA polymerase sigma factor (sigma-70 family)